QEGFLLTRKARSGTVFRAGGGTHCNQPRTKFVVSRENCLDQVRIGLWRLAAQAMVCGARNTVAGRDWKAGSREQSETQTLAAHQVHVGRADLRKRSYVGHGVSCCDSRFAKLTAQPNPATSSPLLANANGLLGSRAVRSSPPGFRGRSRNKSSGAPLCL